MGMDWTDEPDPSANEEPYSAAEPGMEDDGYDTFADDSLDEPESALDGDTEGDVTETDTDAADGELEGDDAHEYTAAEETSPVDDTATVDVVDEEVVGTDPDATGYQDDPGFTAEFPPDLELDPRPEPVDGQPWSDAALLGPGSQTDTAWPGAVDSPDINELMAFDGAGPGTGWEEMSASGDPAVATLARWWQP